MLGGDVRVMTTLLGPRNVSESEVSVDGSIASENRMTTWASRIDVFAARTAAQ